MTKIADCTSTSMWSLNGKSEPNLHNLFSSKKIGIKIGTYCKIAHFKKSYVKVLQKTIKPRFVIDMRCHLSVCNPPALRNTNCAIWFNSSAKVIDT